jgi:hypothetical protein
LIVRTPAAQLLRRGARLQRRKTIVNFVRDAIAETMSN